MNVKVHQRGRYDEQVWDKQLRYLNFLRTGADPCLKGPYGLLGCNCRFRNFEQLHRRLKDMPNYSLSLPPKRFLTSSLDNDFVRERCVLLDKYLRVCFESHPPSSPHMLLTHSQNFTILFHRVKTSCIPKSRFMHVLQDLGAIFSLGGCRLSF
jgi:hypothetical protein